MYVRILNLLFQQKENLIFYADKYYQHFFFPYRQLISLKFHCSEEREGNEGEVEGALEE